MDELHERGVMATLERVVQAALDSQREAYVFLLNRLIEAELRAARLEAELEEHRAADGGKTARGGRSKEQE